MKVLAEPPSLAIFFAKLFAMLLSCLVASLSCFAVDGSQNIVMRILKLDSKVRRVTPQMYSTLKETLDEACLAISNLRRTNSHQWDPDYARAALKCIDDSLVSRGFLYPDIGLVDQLADGLTPFQMSAARKSSFEAHPHNFRRRKIIEQKFPGPFYAVDCDTAGFIYLGVADRLNLPIHFVDIPGYEGQAGHNFVRWREGTNYVNWETMDGCVSSDEDYLSGWPITPDEISAHSAMTDMSLEQVIGYEHTLIAIQYERRGEYPLALSELSRAIKLYPQSLLSRNNYAWDTAVGATVKVRNHAAAFTNVMFVLNIVNDADVRDTLAATYASAGFFKLAIDEEQRVVEALPSKDYRHRLETYELRRVYREDHASSGPEEVFKP